MKKSIYNKRSQRLSTKLLAAALIAGVPVCAQAQAAGQPTLDSLKESGDSPINSGYQLNPTGAADGTINLYEIKETTKYYDTVNGVYQEVSGPTDTSKEIIVKETVPVPTEYKVIDRGTVISTPTENSTSGLVNKQHLDGIYDTTFKDININDPDRNIVGVGIYNDGYYGASIGVIQADFMNNSIIGSYNSDGVAIYNSSDAFIGDIYGDFIGNESYNEYSDLSGSILYNGLSAEIGNIYGDFIHNKAEYIIKNNGTIASVNGNFIENTGTTIYNFGDIGSIKGNFFDNNGTVIQNGEYGFSEVTTIKSIEGNFIGNYEGVFNYHDIEKIKGNFINNKNTAIHNDGYHNGYIGEIVDSVFIGNKIYNYDGGGAIFNGGSIGEIKNTLFLNNFSNTEGGAISNSGDINVISNSQFVNNYVESPDSAYGGAVYNSSYVADSSSFDSHSNGIVNISNLLPALNINNTTFIGNHADSDIGDAKGGAIYSSGNIKLSASDGGVSLVSGNYTVNDGVKDDTAIYMATTNSVNTGNYYPGTYHYVYENVASSLILEAKTGGLVQIDDKINGEKGGGTHYTNDSYDEVQLTPNDKNYKIHITGDSTGTVRLNNKVEGEADMNLYVVRLHLGKTDDVLNGNNMNFHSGTFDMQNGQTGTAHFNNFVLSGNTDISVDADLANKTMDRVTADNYTIENNAKLNVNNIRLNSDSEGDRTSILFADNALSGSVSYTGANPIAYSPIYKYDVSYNPDDGYFTFVRGGSGGNSSDNYNPSVLPAPVATQAGAYTTQLQTFNYAFQHSDVFMSIPSLERIAIKNSGKYALSPTGDATDVGTFSPLLTREETAGWWVKPYASFENVPLQNGPKVSNINYGTLIGYDSNLKSIRKGFDRVLTGYIGYNGSSQRFQGVNSTQNGGILGMTTTLYKGNFFNATTVSAGASAGNNTGMYGSEDFALLLAGIGNKTGYNFEFADGKIILQPSFLISYTFVNTFDYTNAAGVRIKSDPLNAIQLAPGIKLIGNTKSGWQPYIGVSMVWNLLDDSKVTADDVRLPEMSIRPYVQYGVGVQKRIKDRFTAYGQAMVHNGGRNGISLSAGFRWAVGRKQ